MAYVKTLVLKPGDVYRIEANDVGTIIQVREDVTLPARALAKPERRQERTLPDGYAPLKMSPTQQRFQAEVLALLAGDPDGSYSMKDLCVLLDYKPGGHISTALNDLEDRGMIYDANRAHTYKQQRRRAKWRLIPMDTNQHD